MAQPFINDRQGCLVAYGLAVMVQGLGQYFLNPPVRIQTDLLSQIIQYVLLLGQVTHEEDGIHAHLIGF